MQRAEMLAFIPPLQSAIRTGGDGMRVTFEFPETEMGQAAKLLMMRGKRLRVSVEVVEARPVISKPRRTIEVKQ